MTTQVDVYLRFPADVWEEVQYNKLHKACGSVEHIEQAFGIEFSCGEGKYLEDFYQWSDNEEALVCTVTDEELERLDGNVSLKEPPRFAESKELFELNKPYRFTIKYSEKAEESVFYLNGKEVSRKWVG
jgi:hypothetical protein